MHELSIIRNILAAAEAEARANQAASIQRVSCRIGVLRGVDADLLSEAFNAARKGTMAERAELDVATVGVRIDCLICGRRSRSSGWMFECPACGSDNVELFSGDELELCSLELEVPDEN